jgi:hypothetical protein
MPNGWVYGMGFTTLQIKDGHKKFPIGGVVQWKLCLIAKDNHPITLISNTQKLHGPHFFCGNCLLKLLNHGFV